MSWGMLIFQLSDKNYAIEWDVDSFVKWKNYDTSQLGFMPPQGGNIQDKKSDVTAVMYRRCPAQ